MNTKICPLCQAPIPADAPGGFCPVCLLREAEEAVPSGRSAPSLQDVAAAFPQLELLGFIGQGGMGFVYKARQPNLDRVVALKILSPELGCDPAFAERFAREARVLGKLNHPNIVTVFEHGRTGGDQAEGGYFYLLMEYVDGVNLRQAMRASRFTPEQALAVVPGICDALQAAHVQGVWHRDIKPENILLDARGGVKIADFGIARIVGDPVRDFTLTATGGALGSAAYMAPEQHEKPHAVDHRADIYSLGVVIYEMLTGELPLGRFPAPSQRADVNARIDEIVFRTLEKERELRQQSATEVKTDVQGAAQGSDPSAGRKTAGSARQATEVSRPAYGQLAFGLFLAGTLGALLLKIIFPAQEGAMASFAALALLLSIILGVMGWRERFGKLAVLATVFLLSGFAVFVVHRSIQMDAEVKMTLEKNRKIQTENENRKREQAQRELQAREGDDNNQLITVPVGSWLHLLDTGKYAESWQTAGQVLRESISEGVWITRMQETQLPLGKILQRESPSAPERVMLPGLPETRCLQTRMWCSSEKVKSFSVSVTLALEKDGAWRVVRYAVLPSEPKRQETTSEEVITAAQTWLAGVDAGNYAQSWHDAAAFFQATLTEQAWTEAMTSLRKPFGNLLLRKLQSVRSLKSQPGAPDGECRVMQFYTSFDGKKATVETVTFTQEKDGAWRASGYSVQ